MREPPSDLHADQLAAALAAAYGLAGAALAFLPLGYDASAWVYRARTTAGDYFVKLRRQVGNEPSLIVPRALLDAGVARVVAPTRSLAGRLWERVGDYALIVYPFVDGATGMERALTDDQWVAYGALLRQVHEVAVPPDLAAMMRREDFVPAGSAPIARLDAAIGDDATFDDPAQDDLARFWRAKRATIRLLRERAITLGGRLAAAPPPPVLCHADIHTGNMLTDAAGEVWFVDWDETMLAPRERDLMFAVGGGISRQLVSPEAEALFLRGYGPYTPAPLALAYYRYAWAASDIGAFGEQVFFRPDLGPATRREGVEMLTSLFKDGEIVSLALGEEIGA